MQTDPQLGFRVIFFNFRCFHGLFSAPKYLFPRKFFTSTTSDLLKFSPLVLTGDQLGDNVVIRGTTYRIGFLVVTKVLSDDVLQVGEILKIVLRKSQLMMIVMLSDAARNNLGFFEALPSETVALLPYDSLADYKPIIKRANNLCYPFVLHHHVNPPRCDDED